MQLIYNFQVSNTVSIKIYKIFKLPYVCCESNKLGQMTLVEADVQKV